ncbi:UNVERIFIED_CONTAM: hypothetical protein Sradi_3827000 [Sesamum radiatum]|uniref:Retrotransposon gag domain-containing protein n=1 Tax=Sesamum radiatum TaxID=300843 RepID=A0AAW2Q1E7_SESRA
MQTRSQTTSDLQQLQESVTALVATVQELKSTMDVRHETTFAAIAELQQQRIGSFPHSPQQTPTITALMQQPEPQPIIDAPPSPPKFQLSVFDGTNSLEWVFQASQFFDYYSVPDDQRLRRISCYLAGDALGWFKWSHDNGFITSWGVFLQALELRFGPSSYENHRQALFKVRQTGSLMEYQLEFERLCNRVVGLSPESILDCFLSGLRSDIQKELAILHPMTISQAIGLARLIDLKSQDQPFLGRPSAVPLAPPRRQPTTPLPPLLTAPPPRPPTFTTPKLALPIRRLSPAEMQARCAKGLCFNCD